VTGLIPPGPEALVAGDRGRHGGEEVERLVGALAARHRPVGVRGLLGRVGDQRFGQPVVAVVGQQASEAVDHDERRRPVGVVGGEMDGGRARHVPAEHDHARRTDGVEHGRRVGRVLARRRLIDRIRQTDASGVEDDHARHRRQAVDRARVAGLLVEGVDGDVLAQHQQDVLRSVTEDAVRDVGVVDAGEAGLHDVHTTWGAR